MTQDSILPKQYKVNTNTSSNYHKLLLIAMSIKAGQEIHVYPKQHLLPSLELHKTTGHCSITTLTTIVNPKHQNYTNTRLT